MKMTMGKMAAVTVLMAAAFAARAQESSGLPGAAQEENVRYQLCRSQANIAGAVYKMRQANQPLPPLPSDMPRGRAFMLQHVFDNAGANPAIYPDETGARDGEFAWCLDNVNYARSMDR